MTKRKLILLASALFLSCILCIVLTLIGVTKFMAIASQTGGNYPTFPNRFVQIFIGTIYVCLHLIYFLWLIQPRRIYFYKFLQFPDLIRSAFPFLALAFIAYPLGNDTYLYLHYGLMGLNGVDPFTHPASSFISVLSPFLRWHQSSTYGPVSEIFFEMSAIVAPISIVLSVYLLKIFCLLLHLINTYLVFQILRTTSYAEKITLAYLCNPLLLFEQVGSCHIDVFISTTFLLFIFCFKNKNYLFGILTIWLGFLAKTIPILWLPLATIFLIRQRRWSSLVLTVIASLSIIIVLCATVLPTTEAWISLFNPGVKFTAGSLQKIVATYLDYFPNLTDEYKLDILVKFKLLTVTIFAIIYFGILIQVSSRRRQSEFNLCLDMGWVNLILFLFATPWLMPWYTSILLPSTVLNIDERRFVFTSLAFCLSSSGYYGLISAGVFQSWVIVGFPILILFLEMLIPRSKKLGRYSPQERWFIKNGIVW